MIYWQHLSNGRGVLKMKVIGDKVYMKMVFYGTALAGKTSALEWLFTNAIPEQMKVVSKLRQLKTSFGQTLLFDFTPIQLSDNIIVRLYTATGQDYYRGSRPMLLKETDGIFFVVDSQKKELEHNLEMVEEFRKYREEIEGLEEAEVIVLYNKQDLEEIYPIEYLSEKLGLGCWPGFPTCAVTGLNIKEAFREMLSRLLNKMKEQGVLV